MTKHKKLGLNLWLSLEFHDHQTPRNVLIYEFVVKLSKLTIFFLFFFSFFPLFLASSRDMIDGFSPLTKRLKSNQNLNTSGDDSLAHMCYSHSQPVPSTTFTDNDKDQISVEARNDYCFSQPTMLDDLLLCTQQNATQGSTVNSNPFQRLVKRMTRFFVSTKCDETIKRLTTVLDRLGYTWKLNDDSTVTISTVDRRKLPLTFKANLLEMDGKILLDFRLSKGCGLDFKRKFVKIKEGQEVKDAVLNIPVNFSLANKVA